MTDETTLIAWDMTLTQDEVETRVAMLASQVREHWVEHPQPVAVFAPNAGQAMLASLSVVLSGAPLVPLNAHLGAEELRGMLTDASVGLVLVDQSLAGRLALATSGMSDAPRVICWGTNPESGQEGLDRIPATAPVDWSEVRVSAPILFSSGTTGRPKRVVMPPVLFPDGVTVEKFREWAAQRRFVPYGPHLVAGPLYHSGPQQAIWLLAAGVRVFVPKRFDAVAVLDLIERQRIATTLMVPTHFVRLLRARDEASRTYDVSSIRHVTQTGSGCPESVKRRMIDWWGPVFLETYGGTESGGVCFITSQEWLERPNSVGRTLPGYRAFAVDDQGHELPAVREGKLYFEDRSGRGIRYEGEPELTEKAHLRPGVFTLGEIGMVDESGYVYLTDRDSDKVVSGGVNLYPAEIERVLAMHPAVADVALIGVDNPEMGEELRALVVLRAAMTASEQELIEFCRRHLSTLKSPRSVSFVDNLGRSSMGKLNRRSLRQRYGATNAVPA